MKELEIPAPVSSEVINHEEVENYECAIYRLVTVAPLVKDPICRVYIVDQETLDYFLEGYDEYAEFIVGIEKIE